MEYRIIKNVKSNFHYIQDNVDCPEKGRKDFVTLKEVYSSYEKAFKALQEIENNLKKNNKE
jgi:hypothetical protein